MRHEGMGWGMVTAWKTAETPFLHGGTRTQPQGDLMQIRWRVLPWGNGRLAHQAPRLGRAGFGEAGMGHEGIGWGTVTAEKSAETPLPQGGTRPQP